MSKEFTSLKFEWLRQVRADANLPVSSVRLALLLIDYFNGSTGEAWPSTETMAAELNVTPRAVQKGIKCLRDGGHLAVTEGRGRHLTNRYSMALITENDPKKHEQAFEKIRTDVRENTNDRSQKIRTDVHPILLKEHTEETIEDNISPSPAKCPPDRFEDFWAVYPLKVSKVAARKAWAKADAPPDEIIAGAMRYAAERDGQKPKFTKHPANWLDGECWNDEPANLIPFPGISIQDRSGPRISNSEVFAALSAHHAEQRTRRAGMSFEQELEQWNRDREAAR